MTRAEEKSILFADNYGSKGPLQARTFPTKTEAAIALARFRHGLPLYEKWAAQDSRDRRFLRGLLQVAVGVLALKFILWCL